MRTKRDIFRRIESAKKAIAKQRDTLRELISEAEELAECCDEAHDGLESAADALSKYL